MKKNDMELTHDKKKSILFSLFPFKGMIFSLEIINIININDKAELKVQIQ